MEDFDARPRKKLKTSDLPLAAGTRAAIDGLVATTKKKGEFDALRKKVWASFADSVRSPLRWRWRVRTPLRLSQLIQFVIGRKDQIHSSSRRSCGV